MAQVFPFRPYRYTAQAGAPLDHLVTQPYDKIYQPMRERYLSLSPYNLVRVILGKPYEQAAAHFHDWIAAAVLARDPEPAFYAYFQQFSDPDTGDLLTRKGFIGLGQVEPYEAQIVHRHEQTLSGPKKDRLEVLRHTHAHFGQIFMLYPDRQGEIDALLDQAASQPATAETTDEYAANHKLWKITDPAVVARIQSLMADKKLVIADGHHRYETALNFAAESQLLDARRVMMTFVNMHSPGLRILATHRLVKDLPDFNPAPLLQHTTPLSIDAFKQRAASYDPAKILIGIALPGDARVHALETPRNPGDLDVNFLHQRLLGETLGITEAAIREEKHLQYVRGIDAALAELQNGPAQVAFLLQPTRIEEVADVSFSMGVMPQKSTDFYPKLLSGLTIYRLEQ